MTEEVIPTEAPISQYKDEDLVYVDPKLRIVVGPVEWTPAGRPKPLLMKDDREPEVAVVKEVESKAPDAQVDPKDIKKVVEDRRPRRLRYYPWGTYRSMKRVYKIEGKIHKEESNKTLDEVIEKALVEPFWD